MIMHKSVTVVLLLMHLKDGIAFTPFSPHSPNSMITTFPSTHHNSLNRRQSSLKMSSENPGIEKLKEQANRMKLEAEKLEAELSLEKINKLELAIEESESLDDAAKLQKRNDIRGQIEALASRIDPDVLASLREATKDVEVASEETPVTVSALSQAALDEMKVDNSPRVETKTNLYANRKIKNTITEEELIAAVEYYTSLPRSMRQALAKSIDLDEKMAAPAVIVLGLYELSDMLSEKFLQKLYKDELNSIPSSVKSAGTSQSKSTLDAAKSMVQEGREPDDPFNPFSVDGSSAEEVNNMVENFLPRQMRKEGTAPSKIEVEVFTTKVLGKVGKETFAPSGPPEPISGGFVIRGTMASKLKGDGDKMIELLDEEMNAVLEPQWNEKYQVSYMTDPTPQMLTETESLSGSAVLVVHSRDMTPSASTLLNTAVSAVSIFFTFVFAVSIYGQNEVVMDRLTAANNAANYDLTWFNQLVNPFLIAIGVTQASHEVAHLIAAKKEGFKITPPTILPLISLPYLSFQNRIKTSPKNLDALFNFAFIGPAVGMVSSMCFLLIGLQLTLTMTPEQVQYSSSVPVSFLQLSSLGGNIVDYVLGGGDGIILQQDPNTAVPLHPFAIGGFAGLMINAIDTIPLAGTDGGRMSQALLGRSGHVAFSAIVYFSILLYTIFTDHQDIFLSYLFITSFTQKDLEIPARNEVDQAGLGQAAIALTMWSVAILALAPVN